MKDTGEFENEDGIRKFSFLEIAHVLREKARLIALCASVGLFVGLGYSARQSEIFRSIAVIEKTADKTKPLKFDDSRSLETGNQEVAVKYLMDEAANLKAKLQHSEEALQIYKEMHGSVLLDEKQETAVAKLKAQKAQLTEAKAVRLRLEADYRKVTEHAGDVQELLGIAAVSGHPSVLECQQQVASLEARISELSLHYTEKHPKILQVRAQLLDAREALRAAVLKMPELIRATYEEALLTEKNCESAVKEQENAALLLSRQALPYNVLFRDVETDRALYEAILKRLRKADLARGSELTNIPAVLPSEPVSPSCVKVSILGLLGGLVVGVALSLGLCRGDQSLKRVE
ncbi:MAG: hypothetical protein ACFUZC_12895 [Chthoniobacteraceae bacterium]